MEFERVFYKNDFAAGASLLNIYMICKSIENKPVSVEVLIKKMEEQTGEI